MRKKLTSEQIKNIYGDEIIFQSLDWDIHDFYFEEEERDFCIVNIFGNTKEGHSICASLRNFKPSFYVKVPDNWKLSDKNLFLNLLEDKLWKSKIGLDKDSCIITKRKIFYGFRGNNKEKFIKLSFHNLKTFYIARKILNNPIKIKTKSYTFEKFEDSVDMILQFIHQYSFNTTGWFSFPLKKSQLASETKAQIEYLIQVEDLNKVESSDIAPFIQMSYDIECYSHNPELFPSAENLEDYVIQIGMTFMSYGKNYRSNKDCQQIILTLKDCAPIEKENVQVFSFKKEKELLLKMTEIVNNYDPDIIYSYNGHRFDDSYLGTRAKLLNINEQFLDMSKYKYKPGTLETKNFSSSAYGTSTRNFLSLTGRINFDLFVYINREFKLDSFKMDFVAEHFLTKKYKGLIKVDKNKIYLNKDILNETKIGTIITLKDSFSDECMGKITDITEDYIVTEKDSEENRDPESTEIIFKIQKNPVGPQDIFSSWKSGDLEKIKEVAEYCLMDTLIPLLLENELNIFINQMQMAAVTYVPFLYLIDRGQQVKVFSQILRETKVKNFIIPSIKPKEIKFEGAVVLEPVKGAYFEPVIVLDFASLYPSIMMAHNLCYSSLVLNPEYDNLPGIEYKTVEWSDDKGTHKYKFAQNIDSVLPGLLENLIKQRKEVRLKMKSEKDPFKIMVMNGFQLALKVSANSIYGFLTAQTLQCEPIGACVTAIGRQMILQTKNFSDKNFSDQVQTVYGDSVLGNTPLTLKNDKGQIEVKKIEDLVLEKTWDTYQEFKPFDTNRKQKQQAITKYQVWTHKGFSEIKRVIRHKTKKRIYRIITNKGIVCVTEDHSLLSDKLQLLKPEECKPKITKLLHHKL